MKRMPTQSQLSGEQKKIVNFTIDCSLFVQGGAGTGKTVVAIHRVKQAVAEGSLFGGFVGYTAYNRNLVESVRAHLPLRGSFWPILSTADSLFVQALFHGRIPDGMLAAESERVEHLEAVRAEVFGERTTAIATKPAQFYLEEIAWMKGRALTSLEAYQTANREGRGRAVRVTQEDRALLWQLKVRYDEHLHACGKVDWQDLHLRLLEQSQQPTFYHLVIDEAQDLSPVMLTLLLRLVDWQHGGSCTLLADSAQHIYPQGAMPRELRALLKPYRYHPFTLTKNYRNPRPVAQAAEAILGEQPPEEESTLHELPAESADDASAKPALIQASPTAIPEELRALIKAHPGQVAFAFPTRERLAQAKKLLRNANIALFTYHGLKGLDIPYVVLMDCSAECFPLSEDEAVNRAHRKLLYVAMSRTTCRLFVAYPPTGRPSPLLAPASNLFIR